MKEKELPGTAGTTTGNDADSEAGAASSSAEAGIVVDSKLGISVEEQQEILAEINRVTVKNRLSLNEDGQETGKAGKKSGDRGFKAKKKDGLFPALVNTAAVVLLAGGFFLLSSFQGKEEVKIRGADRIYNIAEQALIEEIRRETASLLEAKENEIAVMTSKLAGVDNELQELQDSVEAMMREKEAELRSKMSEAFAAERQRLVEQNLSEAAIVERMRQFDAERIAGMNTQLANYRQQLDAERAGSQTELKSLQEEYRSSLASLQNERSQLLESSRAREAALRTQLEAKTRELAVVTEEAQTSLNDARSELERLSSDQEKAAVIESQLEGYYFLVNDQIQKELLTEAAGTLRVMREYLNTPVFQSIRSIQARRPLYAASIDLLERMVQDLTASKADVAAAPPKGGDEEQIIADLWRKNAELEETLESLNQAAASSADAEAGLKTQTTNLRTQTADLERRLAAAANAENTLRARNTALEQQSTERERTISTLQAQNNSLTQTVAARDTTISTLQNQNNSLTQTVTARETTISTLQNQNNSLTQTVAARDTTISTLQNQNNSLTQTVAARETTISTLQNQNSSLTQTVAARDTTIGELRSRASSQEETIKNLNTQLATIREALQTLSQ
jgi:chromosome segregation ATPase